MRFRLTLMLILLCVSCKRCRERFDDDLCSTRKNNATSALKLQGVYYRTYYASDGSLNYEVFCLYRNGVLRSLGGYTEQEWNNLPDDIISNASYLSKSTSKIYWGIYTLDGTTIQYEKWYPSNDYLHVYKTEGVILNDTTFTTNNFSRCDGSENYSQPNTYHYKSLIVKPDSTNNYIQ